MRHRIVVVRHGRSAQKSGGRLDATELRRWFEGYDALGITDDSHPPESLRDEARKAGIIVASDMERARASAERIAPGRAITLSPLLREIHLTIPSLGSLRLPLPAWALATGVRALYRSMRRTQPAPEAVEQGREATAWLIELAETHGSVLAVSHANLRRYIAREFAARGWIQESGGSRIAHWSAWSFVERDRSA